MAEGEFPGVEHLAGDMAAAFSCVEFVAENGVAEIVKVDPDLMRAAGVENAFDEAHVTARFQDVIFGFRGAALTASDAHPLSMHRMARDRLVDDAGFLARNADDEREINFCHRPRGELAG